MTQTRVQRIPPRPIRIQSPPTRSPRNHDNLLLVVPHKHGSTWLFPLFSDERMLAALGMSRALDIEPLSRGKAWSYDWPHDIRLSPGELAHTRTLAVGQFAYPGALSGDFRALFVHRDPRDVIVSHYFSLRFSHMPVANLNQIRERLRTMSFSQGLRHVIELNVQMKRYGIARAWQESADPRVLCVRYEDLILNPLPTFTRACEHLGAEISAGQLQEVLDQHSFGKGSGRKLGQVDLFAHQRSGLPGQWKTYFDRPAVEMMRRVVGELIEYLGYGSFEAQEEPAPLNDVTVTWTPELERTLRNINEALGLFPEDRVLLYGAGLDLRAVCASTMLYGRNNILGAIDDNADLHGTVIGGQCQVFPPEAVEALRPDVIVVNSTNYRRELYQKARALVRSLPFHVDVFY
jgi:hypothetical protein